MSKINNRTRFRSRGSLPYQASAAYTTQQTKSIRRYVNKFRQQKTADDRITISDPHVITMESNPTGEPFAGVAQGSAEYQRIGKLIRLHSLRIKGCIQHNYSAQDTTGNIISNLARIVVIIAKHSSALTPSKHTVMGNVGYNGSDYYTILDGIHPSKTTKYRILRDIVVDCNPTSFNHESGEDDDVINTYHFDEYIDLMGIEQKYDGPYEEDVTENKLFLYPIALKNDADNFVRLTEFTARLKYTDA